jgi:hypothetical protein
MRTAVLVSSFALVLTLSLATPAVAQNIPQFLAGRQPPENGPLPPERWSATENVAWKTDVPGLARARRSCGAIAST